MSQNKLYNTLEIPGSFLVPGFCIYVLEIVKEKQKWFYIGMTGDSHYPSARSAYYRLVGHLELNQRSTQNQLRVALKEKMGINNDNDFNNVTIKMHHYPIPGFTKLNVKLSDIEVVKQLKLTQEYNEYKKIQQQVLALENALIFVLKDKPGGLVVDYLGIATDLKKALSFYSDSGGKGDPTEDIAQAVEVMMEKLEIVQQMFNEESKTQKDILVEEPAAYYKEQYRFNYNRFFTGAPNEKLSIILQAEGHILGLQDGKQRFIREVTLLSQAFALSMPHPQAMEIKEEVAFFQAVKSRLVKFDIIDSRGRSSSDIDTAIKMIVDQAISSDKVVDIFAAAGIEKSDLSILSDEFLLEVQGMTHKNLAIELLKKILNDEIKSRLRTNLVKSKKFLEMLETAIKKYQNNLLTTAQIIEELIRIAKEVKDSDDDAKRLGLSQDELAFYDALETNDSAVKVLGDETLKIIAKEIADKVKRNATIDWTIRESARAKLMVLVRRTLTKYGYPPDKQQKAIDTVLKQAELIADELVG